MSKEEIRIVFVEDVSAEAGLVEQALKRGGLTFHLRRVENKEAFLRELDSATPDVILSDHGLPSFDGFTALAISREKCPQVPFIFVTSALTREMEIEKLAPGVTDFVLKNQLHFLAPVIRRALQYTKSRSNGLAMQTERRRIMEKILALLEEYQNAGGYLPICSNCKKIRDRHDVWWTPESFFRKKAGLEFTHGICPDCARKFS